MHSGVMPKLEIHILVKPTETIQNDVLMKGSGSMLKGEGKQIYKLRIINYWQLLLEQHQPVSPLGYFKNIDYST